MVFLSLSLAFCGVREKRLVKVGPTVVSVTSTVPERNVSSDHRLPSTLVTRGLGVGETQRKGGGWWVRGLSQDFRPRGRVSGYVETSSGVPREEGKVPTVDGTPSRGLSTGVF